MEIRGRWGMSQNPLISPTHIVKKINAKGGEHSFAELNAQYDSE